MIEEATLMNWIEKLRSGEITTKEIGLSDFSRERALAMLYHELKYLQEAEQ